VNNDIGCWIEYLTGQMREVAVNMPYANRQFGLVLTAVKDSDLVPK
jgi:hypothetical protein